MLYINVSLIFRSDTSYPNDIATIKKKCEKSVKIKNEYFKRVITAFKL